MAARQQPRGTGLRVQYEDLVPKSEWKDQPEATILTIDLPGFAKEQIKVTYVDTSRMIRVTGERPLADQRWSRFNEVFTVPQNCLVDKIHGSFKNNTLTITMPKEVITKTPNLAETSVAEKVKQVEEKRLLEEARRKEDDEKKKKLMEEKDEILRKLQEEVKAKEMAEARRLQEEVIAKEMAAARKLLEEAIAKEKFEERKRVEEASLEKKYVDESARNMKIVKPEDRLLPEVDYTKSIPGSVTKPVSGRAREVVKSAEEKIGYLVEKEKKIEKGMMEKIRGKEITSEEKLGYLVEKEKKIEKGMMEKIRGKEITREEKKLMVNAGVAALVIFALGAYVSYTFCSSSSSSSPSSKPE